MINKEIMRIVSWLRDGCDPFDAAAELELIGDKLDSLESLPTQDNDIRLTNSEIEQITDILRRRANEVAMFRAEYVKDDKHYGSVELALTRETTRLRELASKIGVE